MDVGMEHGYAEGVQRAKGRYDILYGINGNSEFMEVNTLLRPVLAQILQRNSLLLFNGLLHSEPGSSEQLWHADGEHLFCGAENHYLPVHSLNVFVPLIDITPENGGTEFILGSHRLTGDSPSIVWQDQAHKERIGCTGDPVAFTCSAGRDSESDIFKDSAAYMPYESLTFS
jgi:ectoine hydroxylase-related dioxygenase (phytanoyl-CoA dioxygenase family)